MHRRNRNHRGKRVWQL